MNFRKSFFFLCLTITVALLSACFPDKPAPVQIRNAVAVVVPTEGNNVSGNVTFTAVKNGVLVKANIRGLSPGKHGFHVHQYGDIRGKKGKTAGGHFNPHHMDHGSSESKMRHVGDLGNITADNDGVANLEKTLPLELNGPNSIIGRGIVIHEQADDLVSQPTGAAGGRVAVGVIGVAKP